MLPKTTHATSQLNCCVLFITAIASLPRDRRLNLGFLFLVPPVSGVARCCRHASGASMPCMCVSRSSWEVSCRLVFGCGRGCHPVAVNESRPWLAGIKYRGTRSYLLYPRTARHRVAARTANCYLHLTPGALGCLDSHSHDSQSLPAHTLPVLENVYTL